MSLEIFEIIHLKKRIDDMIKETETLRKEIEKTEARIITLEQRKNMEIFNYQPLIDGKINGIQIESITVHGCDCLEVCDGQHNIYIYDKENDARINFNNGKRFSIRELEKLNYIEKLNITVDAHYKCKLKNVCKLLMRYPEKLVVYGYICG